MNRIGYLYRNADERYSSHIRLRAHPATPDLWLYIISVIPRQLAGCASKQNHKALAVIHNQGRRGTCKPCVVAMGAMSSGGFDNPESAGLGTCCAGDGLSDSVRVGSVAILRTVKTDSRSRGRWAGRRGRREHEALTWETRVVSLRTVQRGRLIREESEDSKKTEQNSKNHTTTHTPTGGGQ